MNKIFSIVATALALMLGAAPAMAQTTCNSTVSALKSDANGGTNFYVTLASGVVIQVSTTDSGVNMIREISGTAFVTQSPVTVTFAASGASCTTGTRTDMSALLMTR